MSAVSEAASRVYAKALFDLGVGEGNLAAIGEDLHAVQDALNGLEGDLQALEEKLPGNRPAEIQPLADRPGGR